MSEIKEKPVGAVDESLKNKLDKNIPRRGFIKSAVVAGLAIVGGATVAKKAAEVVLKEDNRKLYRADELGVERASGKTKSSIL